ncbi:response regulator [Halioxenophilus aromaticivorans]
MTMTKAALVVDDSISVRQVVSLVMKNAGFEVYEAADGKQALDLLDGRKLHIIISDINMPELDGISFVKAAKAIEEYQYTPILMLTTESSSDMKKKGAEAGVKAWLVKPFQPKKLLMAINKLT